MQVLRCPEEINISFWSPDQAVFLAGGITGCPDWQSEVVNLLRYEDVMLINPRRENFDVNNKDLYKQQIQWEHNYIKDSDIIFFWFPKETLCPITLFELGKALGLGMDIVVGCHPEYTRRLDVIEQIGHMDHTVIVQDTLEGTVNQLKLKL